MDPAVSEGVDPRSFQEGRMLGHLEGELAYMQGEGLLRRRLTRA